MMGLIGNQVTERSRVKGFQISAYTLVRCDNYKCVRFASAAPVHITVYFGPKLSELVSSLGNKRASVHEV